MSDDYHVSVTKDDLVFSAAHFITFNGDQCERLHGHNYRVRAEVAGPLDENEYVVDFIFLRDALKAIVATLDHRVLLPRRHPSIKVTEEADETVARFEEKRWVFPREDCILLPIANTTAELLAAYFVDELVERFEAANMGAPHRLAVDVEENFGQWATCTRRMDGKSRGSGGPRIG